MIIVMETGDGAAVKRVIDKIIELGYTPHVIRGVEKTVVAAVGDERGKARMREIVESLPGVETVVPILQPFKLVGREFKKEDTIIDIDGVEVGGNKIVVMAGPCSVESREQILSIAEEVKKCGAAILRGGAYKPRTSPYAFQGLEEEGLKLLAETREKTGLKIITEVVTSEDVPLVADYADILQIGARNMQNYALLKAVGNIRKPICLKRGMMSTVTELLMSAEYILSHGNYQVILCERGIRTFETLTRNTLDLNAIPAAKKLTHLPIMVDPSHGTGRWDLVIPMAKAAVAAGADGIIVEVHDKPEAALSDGPQSLKPAKFAKLMEELRAFVVAANREI